MPKKKTKRGRPTAFTQKIADTICFRLMEGETLREICRDEEMPARSSVHLWLSNNDDFSDQYVQARDLQAEQCFDEMFEIADDGSNDWMKRSQGDEDVEVVNHEHIQRSKLRIDTRKWALARMAPKKYGDKLKIAGGDEDDNPIAVEVDSRSDARRAAFMLLSALDE